MDGNGEIITKQEKFMNLFLLAAGRGARLMPLTTDVPKCLVSLGDNSTLLEKVLFEAKQSGVIKQVVIIGGYRFEKIEGLLENLKLDLLVKVLYNPFYEISSPLVSLYIAYLNGMGREDFIICNGDTFYRAELFKRMANLENGITLAIEPNAGRDQDGVKVLVDGYNNLTRVGKNLHAESASGVSAGFVAVKGDAYRDIFVETLRNMMRTPDNLDTKTVWHSIFNVLSEAGAVIRTIEASSEEWFEIDHAEDWQKFMDHFVPPQNK
jgi:L-glutamine-phosphate cytidylyltransferase